MTILRGSHKFSTNFKLVLLVLYVYLRINKNPSLLYYCVYNLKRWSWWSLLFSNSTANSKSEHTSYLAQLGYSVLVKEVVMVTGFLNELSMSNKLNSWLDVFGIFFFLLFLVFTCWCWCLLLPPTPHCSLTTHYYHHCSFCSTLLYER